jgi:hypothetical protein
MSRGLSYRSFHFNLVNGVPDLDGLGNVSLDARVAAVVQIGHLQSTADLKIIRNGEKA